MSNGGPFQTISYRGYWLQCSANHVKVDDPYGRRWPHSYSSLAGAKAAVRADIARKEQGNG